MKTIIAFFVLTAALLLAGCGKYVGHAYGTSSGKTYSAPDTCQAVAACKAAGETDCLYAHTDQFSCVDEGKRQK